MKDRACHATGDVNIPRCRNSAFARLALVLVGLVNSASLTVAEEPPVTPPAEHQPNEKFVPADQLDAVFDRDRRGVLMQRREFERLLEQARANQAALNVPSPILIERAAITVTPGDQQAIVVMELKVRQFAEGWQMLSIRSGNLFVEKVEVNGGPGVIARDPANPGVVQLAHLSAGEFTVIATLSTPLAALGSDHHAAFELPGVPATLLKVACPAGRHLLLNDLKLNRPATEDAEADYMIPVGNATDVRLRWVVERREAEAQTLVFVRTNAQLQIQKESLRWESDSHFSVFGGTVNQLVARVPSRLEITSVESAGLEGWSLEDDAGNPGFTRLTLTYRQPFTNDRVVRIKAVSAHDSTSAIQSDMTADSPESREKRARAMHRLPDLQFAEVTEHTGRVVVSHEEGLRLVSETGSGVRRVSAAELGLSTDASVFDFWMQPFDLKVAAQPRDRELFAESNATLVIDDTAASFQAQLTVETLNAPLFELPVYLPEGWQLQKLSVGSSSAADSTGLSWENGANPGQILITPVKPVAPGELLPLVLDLSRTLSDPDVEQKLALPVVRAGETTTVGGRYVVRYGDDLIIAPLSLTGLTPLSGTGAEQVFQNLGTDISGELSIVRKPARLAARSVLKTWADARQQTFDGEIITDVLNGTIRTLTIRLSESLGPDVRFVVRSVGPVPGVTPIHPIQPVTIVEQVPGPSADGLRPFTLKLDHRFAGALSLHAFVQQPRVPATPISAPIVQVQDAVRQHGVLVFEATPEQQLAAGPEVLSIPGLFPADAGVVDAPPASTGRRTALTFRFVHPGYAFQVLETRFATSSVPSAVCELLANVCTLNDSGSIQRWSHAKLRSSGVQTLRFTLPGEENSSFLWSTMLNDEPVEVRRDAGDYLVAVPSDGEAQEYSLTVLFETAIRKNSVFGTTDQGPLQLSIDVGDQGAVPIDVLKQTWRVHYPQSSLLTGSDGPFRPVAGVDQPGWLMSLGTFSWPEPTDLFRRLIPLTIFLLILFLLTVMVSRRRWKTLAAVAGLAILFSVFSLQSRERAASSFFNEAAKEDSVAAAGWEDQPFSADQPTTATQAVPESDMASDFANAAPREVTPSVLPPPAVAGIPLRRGDNSLLTQPAQVMPQPAGEDFFALGVQAPAEPAPGPVDPQPASPADARQSQADAAFPAKPKQGSARLSVNVHLDVPADYRTRDFVSVADTVQAPLMLSIMVQSQRQIAAIRMLSGLLVIVLVWWIRRSTLVWKLTVILSVLLFAIGFLPLIPNQVQSVVDGVALGAGISLVVVLISACCRCCLCPRSLLRVNILSWKSRTAILIVGVFLPCAVDPLVAQQTSVPQPDLVVPYTSDQSPLEADRVFVRHEDFLRLYEQANPGVLKGPEVNPLGSNVAAAYFRSGALTRVEGIYHVLSLEGRFVVWCDSDQTTSVPLPIGPVAVRSVQLDGREGTLQPLVVGAQAAELQDFSAQKITQTRQAPAQTVEGPAYAIQVSGKGLHVVDVKFDLAAQIEGELGRADFPLRSPASGTLEWTLPADGLDAKIHGRTNVFRRDGRTVIVPVAQLSTIRLQWLPKVETVAGDTVFHAATASAFSVQDSGMILRTTVSIQVRQGELPELELSLPEGYSVQSVTGDDVAGWTVENTDTTRSMKLQLRRAVNDASKLTMQLYAPLPASDQLTSQLVPITVVKGASRDQGTVILKTGSQFQVRSDALSAVTQVNPEDATTPDGEELPGRAMLAWRYTRHPASVTVRIAPTADEMRNEAVHAVRLEAQRQLWSSRMTLRIFGSPRSRLDILVPERFLPLDVAATGLKDWYFADATLEEVVGDGMPDSNSDTAGSKVLSIQLSDARSGLVQIVLQGQTDRDADRSRLTLRAPVVLNSTAADSQLAVWLDAASENAGFESGVGNGQDWLSRPLTTVQATFGEISQTAPSLTFQSSANQPGPLSIRLRDAVSTLIAESVTVTNVTETALEITLALHWVVNRASADTFAVELSSGLASILNLEVPGLRRIAREDLNDGRSRLLIQLQQPVSDRLFVVGTASLPLPGDKVIRAEVPTIVIPSGAPSTLSGQQHFWVVVNQSSGLLQPGAVVPEDQVRPEQITTRIPEQLLQQAVTILKLRPETAGWNLVYPDKHQVAPAVVTLATHATVISDDGSWRSRHQLRVTNESRQFLPVILPAGSRLMYCLVEGQPGRVVVRGEGEDRRYLIPIPQSGALASGFDIEFALAGRFEGSAAAIRRSWRSQRLKIPVPKFPEFRDDAEQGISLSRNRWSVFVPESWRAAMADDPAATNVVEAVSDQLEDASLLSDVEEAANLLKAAKGASRGYFRQRLQSQVQSRLNQLHRLQGNSGEAESQRGVLLGKLNELNNEFSRGDDSAGTVQQQAQRPNDLQSVRPLEDNGYLFETEAIQNRWNKDNTAQFWSSNSIRVGQDQNLMERVTPQTPQGAALDGESDFRFGLKLQDPEELSRQEILKEADKGLKKKSELKDMKQSEEALEKGGGVSDRQSGQSRSRLLQRRGSSAQENVQNDLAESAAGRAIAGPGQLLSPNNNAPFQAPSQFGDSLNVPARATAPTGLLSLQFEIPEDGSRLDFLRGGGNPELSLDVRSAEAFSKGTGMIWLLLCTGGVLLLADAGRRGQSVIFFQRLFLIVTLSGLAAVIWLTGDLRSAGMLLTIAGSLGIAGLTAFGQLRRG